MKQVQSIQDLYAGWMEGKGKGRRRVTLFVVPEIRFDFRRSDYLYQLYRSLLEGRVESGIAFSVKSLRFWQHGQLLKAAFRDPGGAVVHYHWFEIQDLRSLAGMFWKWFCLFWFHKRGGWIVWTMHNPMPHNPVYTRLNRIMRRWLASISDVIHLHCEEIVKEVSLLYDVPDSKLVVYPHPQFDVHRMDGVTARETLHQTRTIAVAKHDTLFLMFGQISHYKQLEPVCEWFAAMAEEWGLGQATHSNTISGPPHLLIAGPVKKGQEAVLERIQRIAERTHCIHIISDWIRDEEMDVLFSASDCVVLNMKQIWMSGVAKMAQSYGLPMILPRIGCLPTLDTPNSTLHFFDGQDELTQAIRQFRRPS